jgi:MOSC domain-containing protein YiiM
MQTTVAGISIRTAPKAAPTIITSSAVTLGAGLPGNFRGIEKARRRRQVTILMAQDWRDACAESGCDLDWSMRRCDLLLEGPGLPMAVGILVRIGTAVLEITGECDPCMRMDAIHPGLRAALTPSWRGGRLARVEEEGDLEIGSIVTLVEGELSQAA